MRLIKFPVAFAEFCFSIVSEQARPPFSSKLQNSGHIRWFRQIVSQGKSASPTITNHRASWRNHTERRGTRAVWTKCQFLTVSQGKTPFTQNYMWVEKKNPSWKNWFRLPNSFSSYIFSLQYRLLVCLLKWHWHFGMRFPPFIIIPDIVISRYSPS